MSQSINRRKLTPSMSLLLSFEAAARYESFTQAADELFLTQGAVSRQVRTLEKQLGVTLLRRDGRKVVLTDTGRIYAHELGLALAHVRSATLQLVASQSGQGTLRLATLPTFGSKWLLPRLHAFYTANPGMLIHLHSRIRPVDFETSEIDAAITVGSGEWPGLIAHRLHTEALALIAKPDTLQAGALPTQVELAKHLLLTVASHPQAWSEWFARQGFDHHGMRTGPNFELTSHLIDAVRAGIGLGLVPQVLVNDELESGQLVCHGPHMKSRRSYYLVYPRRALALPALNAFKVWLLSEGTCPKLV